MIKSIYIKNMVCPRCISAVEQTMHKLVLHNFQPQIVKS